MTGGPSKPSSAFVVDVQVHRATHSLAATSCKPIPGRAYKSRSNGRIVNGLKLTKEADVLVPHLTVDLVIDGCDPADDLALTSGQKKLHRCMLKERILVSVEMLTSL